MWNSLSLSIFRPIPQLLVSFVNVTSPHKASEKAFPSKPVRVLLVDDHTLVRAGMRLLLQGFEAVEVVGEAGDGATALCRVEQLLPDIVLMDIAMEGLDGLEAAARIQDGHPEVRVVILSMLASEEHVLKALRSGASGYLLKDAAALELERAIRSVGRGEIYLSPPISKQLVEQYLQRVQGGERPELDLLTPRQRETLRLVAEGHSNKEIARLLGVGVKTVETHRAQLMSRLNIHDLPGLVRYAIRIGLVGSGAGGTEPLPGRRDPGAG
jgi:DNA-binding NarL/FixJ family response regulator